MTVTTVLAVFGWSLLLTRISAASNNVSVSNLSAQIGQGKKVVPTDDKCGIQAQLSEMQEQLREIKMCNGNKTGKEKDQCFDSLIEESFVS